MRSAGRGLRVIGICVLQFAVVGCAGFDRQQGVNDARKQIDQGKFTIESHGLAEPWYPLYQKILFEKYAIESRPVAGCIVDEKTVGHADGFNETMKNAITKRHGKDVFKKAMIEAKAEYEKKHLLKIAD